jgi:hypothetical protein
MVKLCGDTPRIPSRRAANAWVEASPTERENYSGGSSADVGPGASIERYIRAFRLEGLTSTLRSHAPGVWA